MLQELSICFTCKRRTGLRALSSLAGRSSHRGHPPEPSIQKLSDWFQFPEEISLLNEILPQSTLAFLLLQQQHQHPGQLCH